MAVTAVYQYVGIVKAITKNQIVLNLAIQVADFPTPPGATSRLRRATVRA